VWRVLKGGTRKVEGEQLMQNYVINVMGVRHMAETLVIFGDNPPPPDAD
jgi:hypothetical protein